MVVYINKKRDKPRGLPLININNETEVYLAVHFFGLTCTLHFILAVA